MPFDEDPSDDAGFVPPLPPDDRLWRHPSEMHGDTGAPGIALPSVHARAGGPARATSDSRHLVLATVAMLIGVAAILSAVALTGALGGRSTDSVASGAADGPGAVAYDRFRSDVEPAIVRVTVETPTRSSITTGLVVRADGHILTGADAIDGASAITVTTSDHIAYNATVVGVDVADDLAVLDIERVGMSTVPVRAPSMAALDTHSADDLVLVAQLADHDRPWTGVATIDSIDADLLTDAGAMHYGMVHAIIETTSPPPLAIVFGTDGDVIGLTTTRRASAASRTIDTVVQIPFSDRGITSVWSTPIAFATKVADDLIDDGHLDRPAIGVTTLASSTLISIADVASRSSTSSVGSSPSTDGAVVVGVAVDGPADRAGIRPGDVITAIDDSTVDDPGDLVVVVRMLEPGTSVALRIHRGDLDLTVAVTATATA